VRIPREVIEELRERISIIEVITPVVTLKRKGSSMMGLCPFHQEKSPSFSVVPSKGIFHCFGCGEGGDIFTFVQKTRGLGFYEAAKELADQAGVALPERELSIDELRRIKARAGIHEICQHAMEHFQSRLLTSADGQPALDYLHNRGVSDESIKTFKIGYAPDKWDDLLNNLHTLGITLEQAVAGGLARFRDPSNANRGGYDLFRGRIIVPILDRRGRVIAFGGRLFKGPEDAPKYVNSPETDIYKKSRILYGLPQALSAIQRNERALIVEGYFDVIALSQAGFPEAVATCGTALTSEHLQTLRTLTPRVIALFDSDEAGLRAAERSMPLFLTSGVEPLQLSLEGAKDPDEFIQEFGAEAFETQLARSEPLFELVLHRVAERCGTTPGGRQRAVEELAPLLRRFPTASRSVVVARVAGVLAINERSIHERIGRSTPQQNVPPPPLRWQPGGRLRTIFWLLLHHPDAVIEELLTFTHPEWLTDNPEALRAIGLLLQSTPLPDILQQVGDQDVARVLRMEAANDREFKEEKVARQIRRYIIELEDRHLSMRLSEINVQLGQIRADQLSELRTLLTERGRHQNRRGLLKSALMSRDMGKSELAESAQEEAKEPDES
jgi:DNA primase